MSGTPDESVDRLRFRSVALQDARFLFELRQDPEVVQYSGTGRGLEWERHVDWLRKKIQEPTCQIWIIEDDRGPAGQVRLDLVDDAAEISIAFLPDRRGRGYGAFAIPAAVAAASEMGAEAVVARVHTENLRSRRTFERAGFHVDQVDGSFLYYRIDTGSPSAFPPAGP